MTDPQFPAEQPSEPAQPHNLAGWGIRAGGFLIDYAPIFLVNLIFFNDTTLSLLGGLLGVLYWVLLGYLDGVSGQTPGKALLGTRVVNQQGDLIGGGAGIGRKFAHIVDTIVCFLGWLLPIVDSKRQTIADKIMATFVVTGIERRSFSIDLWLPPKA